MEEIDDRHIHVLEFPKLLLWTDRDLEFFLEEMPSEATRMNNDIYDAFIKEVESGQDYSPVEAFNLAYYECVRISLAKYPESNDIFDVLEMDIQHNQNHVNYGFTDLIMNMVWAMLHSTGTAQRFSNKLHSYLVNYKKLKFGFREFFTPNDRIHMTYPYEKKEEPRYKFKFTPCPDDMKIKPASGAWCELTRGYKEHLIEELLMLWPADKRGIIRKCIMDEKAKQLNDFKKFAKKHVVEIIDEPETHLHINMKENLIDQRNEDEELLLQQVAELKAQVNQLAREKATLEKNNHDLVAREEHHRNEKDKARAANQTLLAQMAKLKKDLAEKNVEPEFEPEDIRISKDRKIDVIKVLHAMCKIGLFQKTNGSEITQNAVMKYWGKMLNDDFSEYSANLSTSKSKTKELSYMQIFDDLRKAAYDYFKKS